MSTEPLDPADIADVLGDFVADLRKEMRREVDAVVLECRAALADTRAENADLRMQLKAATDAGLARIAEAQAAVKDGRDGADGKPGRDGADGKDGAPGLDGKSVELDDLRSVIAAEVKQAVPSVADFAPLIEEHVVKAVAVIPTPRDGIDGKDGKDGSPGRDGVDGQDADPELTRALVIKEVAEHVAAIPRPQDGRDGRDGKDADWSAIERQIEVVAKGIIAELPVPKDGRDGMDGSNGKDGQNGADGRDGMDGKSIDPAEVAQMVTKAVAELPKPRDGIDGKNATIDDLVPVIEAEVDRRVALIPVPKDGADGRDGIDGKDGEPGRDGAGITEALIGRDGDLVLTFSDGRTKSLGAGFAADLNAAAVEQMIAKAIEDWHQGIWEHGRNYTAGKLVTYGGSIFLSRVATKAQPTKSDDWLMILKRGRDGKDADAPRMPRPPMALPPKDGAE